VVLQNFEFSEGVSESEVTWYAFILPDTETSTIANAPCAIQVRVVSSNNLMLTQVTASK
jgi:hypothetical protein